MDLLDDDRPARALSYLGNHTFGWTAHPMDRFIFHMEDDQALGYSVYYNGIFATLRQRTGP